MTVSIYQNPFVFEKHGQAFSNYIGLCIKHFNDKKDEFGLTTRHHINPKFLTNNVYDNSPWNVVHLLHEVHVEAHNFLKEAMPNEKGAIFAVSGLKSGCPRKKTKKRWEDPEYVAGMKKMWEDQEYVATQSERTKALWENPDYVTKQKSWDRSEHQKKSWANPDRKKPKKIKCEYCGKEFSPSNFSRHLRSCKMNPNRIA